MNKLADRLLKLKGKVDDAKASVAKHKGRREELLRRLKEDHKAGSEKEARTMLRQLKKELDTMETELETMVLEIETAVEDMEG